MTVWQPIETAPKDGTWVIGYRRRRSDEDRSRVAAIFYEFDTVTDIIDLGNDTFRRVKRKVGKWFESDWDEFEPTHWLQLPQPPEDS